MSKKSTDSIRVNNVDDVESIPDLISAIKIMKELHITTNNVKTLGQAKAKIIENFSEENAQDIYQKNDRNPMQIALKENEQNRSKLTSLISQTNSFLATLPNQFREDLNRCFPDFNRVSRQKEKDLDKSSCYILVAGETGSGKSSIINLLLGCKLLPTSDLHGTSNICELRQAERRCYILYHKEKRKPPEIFDYDESRSLEQFMENLSVHIRLSDPETEDNYYEKIEIYWPFPYNMEGIVFVDTPGVGDNLNLSANLQKYMHKSFGFIYVVNSAAAGGIHRDRLGRLLRLAQERGDEDFDPSAALFVCNKHDLLKEEEVESVMDVSLEKLQGCYPGVVRDQLFPISAKRAIETAEYRRGILRDHTRLIEGVRNVLPKIFHSQLSAHYRWLASVINRNLHTLKVTSILDAKGINDNVNVISDLKNQMENLGKRADDRITLMKLDMSKSMQKVVTDILQEIELNRAELSMWGPNTYPQPEMDWKTVARKASISISDRICQFVDQWDMRKHVVGHIKQQVLDKFKSDIELFEDQMKQIEGTFLGSETKTMTAFHQSMKPRSNIKAIWKANKKEKLTGDLSLGTAVGEANSLNVKNNEVKRIFKEYSKSNKPGELMRQATELFIQDLTQSTLSESLKRYFSRFTKEIDEISRLIPTFLQMDRELLMNLTADNEKRERNIVELYPNLIRECFSLRSHLDMFYCRKLMKTDFQFSSFKLENNQIEIGEGSFAKVYKARMPGSDTLSVALKVCKSILCESTVSEVLTEHQISRELKHKNITRYYGSSRVVKNGQIKFVMVLEYCSQTLQQLLQNESHIVPAKCGDNSSKMATAMLSMADLVIQLCSGLGYLHQKSIVHRDLKTENILVTADRVVKLSDFGLAKIGLAASLKVGSQVYMAPEVLLGDTNSPYDTKADIYSLGIILWELWYGQDVAEHIQMRIVDNLDNSIKLGIRPALTIKTKPPTNWSGILTSCWSRKAIHRPTCDILLEFFHAFVKQR